MNSQNSDNTNIEIQSGNEVIYLTEEQVENLLISKNYSNMACEEPACFTELDEEKDELKELLREFNLENTFSAFSACGFKYDNIRYINKDDLEVIFPGQNNTALKAELREKLFSWKTKNFPDDIATTLSINSRVHDWIENNTGNCSRSNTPTSQRTNCSVALYNTHVNDILKSSNAGEGLLNYYKNNKSLEKEHRKILMNCLVEFYYNSDKNMYIIPGPQQLDKMAAEILEVFPSESKDIYYISRKVACKPNPTGLLFNRFNNLNRKRQSLVTTTLINQKIPKFSSQNFVPDVEMVSIKNKIKIMQNDERDSVTLWQSTFTYRTQDVKKLEDINEIFQEWPFYKQSGGENFIDLDFDMMYPGKKYLLINKWNEVEKSLMTYYNKYIKDKQYRILYEKLTSQVIDKNSRDCALIILLNTVLKPTSRATVKLDATTSIRKTTIKDAVNSCIVHIKTVNDLQLARENKMKNSIENKSTIQPYIITIGAELTQLTDFYVNIGDTLLKFTSFVAAFDTCFKSFQVFNLQYPKESPLVWLFIQKNIFDITTEYDIKSSTLAEFLGTLKNY